MDHLTESDSQAVQRPVGEDRVPTCDRCGIGITSGLMAAMCPYRERCAFWPEDKESQDFLDGLDMRYVPERSVE